IGADALEELGHAELLGLHLRGRPRRGVARAPLDHAHLADELPREDGAEHDRHVAALAQDLDLAALDAHHAIAGVALPEEDIAGIEIPLHLDPPSVRTRRFHGAILSANKISGARTSVFHAPG